MLRIINIHKYAVYLVATKSLVLSKDRHTKAEPHSLPQSHCSTLLEHPLHVRWFSDRCYILSGSGTDLLGKWQLCWHSKGGEQCLNVMLDGLVLVTGGRMFAVPQSFRLIKRHDKNIQVNFPNKYCICIFYDCLQFLKCIPSASYLGENGVQALVYFLIYSHFILKTFTLIYPCTLPPLHLSVVCHKFLSI